MTSAWLKVTAVLALAFSAGAASQYTLTRVAAVTNTSPDPWQQLDVTPLQRQQIDQIFSRYQPATDSLLQSLIPRLETLTDSMHAEISALLTPEQRQRLQSMERRPSYVIKRKTSSGVQIDTLK